jgi:hypothetical protein
MNDTTPATTFVEMVRRAKRHEPTPAETWFWLWCDACQEETQHRLKAETPWQEIYTCDGCGAARIYTVR